MPRRPVKPLILAGWPKYKRDHARNKKRYPMTRAAFARELGISPSHLSSKEDPDIMKIAAEIDRLALMASSYVSDVLEATEEGGTPENGKERQGGYETWLMDLEDGGETTVSDELLLRQIDQQVRRAVDASARFLGQFSGPLRRGEHVQDAPLALYEMERTAQRLLGLAKSLKPLVSEQRKRDLATLDRGANLDAFSVMSDAHRAT